MTKRGHARAAKHKKGRSSEKTTWIFIGGALVVMIVILAVWS